MKSEPNIQLPKGFDGLIAVNKPKGMVSRRVSSFLMKKIGKQRIGHAGTLDPMAEGVLPILLGKATKLQDFITDLPKSYEFDLDLGYETTTLDLEGEVVSRSEIPDISLEKIHEVVSSFTGEITQIPPVYSAVKFKGKPLYRYARQDKSDQVPLEDLKRNVVIYDLQLIKRSDNIIKFYCKCSKGTYIRSLARDISIALGTLGTIIYLNRTMSAGIKSENSIDFEDLINSDFNLEKKMVPLEQIPVSLKKIKISEPQLSLRLQQGQRVGIYWNQFQMEGNPESLAINQKILLLDRDGMLFGVGVIKTLKGDSLVIGMVRGLI